MGYLFENMDEMDIQAERRNTAREKQRADVAEKRADAAEKQREEENVVSLSKDGKAIFFMESTGIRMNSNIIFRKN